MHTYYVTVGQRYRREPHPRHVDAHPDGWFTILAVDEDDAHRQAVRALGCHWSSIYTEDDPPDPEIFPRGSLGQLAGDAGR